MPPGTNLGREQLAERRCGAADTCAKGRRSEFCATDCTLRDLVLTCKLKQRLLLYHCAESFDIDRIICPMTWCSGRQGCIKSPAWLRSVNYASTDMRRDTLRRISHTGFCLFEIQVAETCRKVVRMLRALCQAEIGKIIGMTGPASA